MISPSETFVPIFNRLPTEKTNMRQKDNIQDLLLNVKKNLGSEKSNFSKQFDRSRWGFNLSHFILLIAGFCMMTVQEKSHQKDKDFFAKQRLQDRLVVNNLNKEIVELKTALAKAKEGQTPITEKRKEQDRKVRPSVNSGKVHLTAYRNESPPAPATPKKKRKPKYRETETGIYCKAHLQKMKEQQQYKWADVQQPKTKKVVTAMRSVPSRNTNPPVNRKAKERKEAEAEIIAKTTKMVQDILAGKEAFPEKIVQEDTGQDKADLLEVVQSGSEE